MTLFLLTFAKRWMERHRVVEAKTQAKKSVAGTLTSLSFIFSPFKLFGESLAYLY